ncbi:hypothetical protein BH11BAC3_BH11BAC3_27800 [soil metagenome]
MKLTRKILSDGIFIGIITLLSILSIFSYKRILDLNKKSDWIIHTNKVRMKLQEVLFYVNDAEKGQRGFLLTRDSSHLQPYFDAFQNQQEVLANLDSLFIDNTDQLRNLKTLRLLVYQRLQGLSSVIKYVKNGANMKVVMAEEKQLTDDVKTLVNLMLAREDELLKTRTDEKNYAATITPFYSLVLSVFSILAVALAYFFLRSETKLRFHAQDSIKKLNEYFKDLPAAFSILKGPDHIHEMTNLAYGEVTGHRNVMGKSIKEVLPELAAQALFDKLDKVYKTGEAFIGKEMPIEISAENEPAVKRYYNLIYQPILDKKGATEGILVFAYEITELIAARNKLALAEQHSRLAIEAANIGTFDWDMENKIFNSSARLLDIFGFSENEHVTHQDLINTFHPDDKPVRDKAVEDSYLNESLAYEARIIRKDRSIKWINVYGKIIHGFDKETLRMYGTVIDITEQKVILEELIKSEAKFRLLSESMPQIVWTANWDGTLTYLNKAMFDYTNFTTLEAINSEWINIIHADDWDGNVKKWKTAMQDGEAFSLEHRFKNKAGEYRWFLSQAIPQKSSGGILQRWIGTSTDIQEHKDISAKLEMQVGERTQQLAALNEHLLIQNKIFAQGEENALIGSYSWNLQEEGLEYSDNLFRLFGFEPGEFIPTYEKFLTLVHPEDRGLEMFSETHDIVTRLTTAHIYRVITKDGTVKHFRSTGKLIGDNENVLMIGTVQDISRDQEYNEILHNKNIELERTNAELESFNYIASHDLQEPLRKIQAFSQRILSKEGENFSSLSLDYFGRIQSAAARMQNLIQALLSYSKTIAIDANFKKTNLNAIVENVIYELQEEITEKNGVIKYENLPELKLITVQIHQLFTNLINNAIKYSKSNVAPEIIITATLTAGKHTGEESADPKVNYWKITVADNGIGFEQQYGNKIFELFQRLHGSADYIGTGIGLAICKKIMHNHQGFISAIGKPGTGSIFNIYFPDL